MGITLRARDIIIRTRDITIRARGERRLLILCTAWLTFGILSLCCSPAWSQELIPTSPTVPVGSGARAQGMGGAFIAVADDATAASWNPGGLGQLQRPEMSAVGSWFSRSEHYDGSLENDGGSHSSSSDVNYLSCAYAKNIWQRNMFFSFNYQKLFDFSRRVKLDIYDYSAGVSKKADFQQEGSLYTFSPAMAIECISGLYVGFAYNIWSDAITGKSHWKSTLDNSYSDPSLPEFNTKLDYKDFRGENLTLGFLWKITQQLQLGGVYKTPFKASVRNEHQLKGSKDTSGPFHKTTEDRIDFPASYGAGLSYRLGNSWTFAGDVTLTEWQNYIISDSSGNEIGPFRTVGDVPHKDSTCTVRLGAEYAYVLDKLGIVLPFRAGVFYDPEPSVNAPQDFYGLSLGCGVADKRMALDFAYQFRTGNPVNSVELGLGPDDKGQTSNEGKIQEHLLLCSLIFYL